MVTLSPEGDFTGITISLSLQAPICFNVQVPSPLLSNSKPSDSFNFSYPLSAANSSLASEADLISVTSFSDVLFMGVLFTDVSLSSSLFIEFSVFTTDVCSFFLI